MGAALVAGKPVLFTIIINVVRFSQDAIRLLQFHAVGAHLHFFAQQVAALIAAIDPHIHPAAIRSPFAHGVGKVIHCLVAHHGSILPVGDQQPGFGFIHAQYLGFAAELELVGSLVQRPGGVAAALELNIGIGQVAPACLADRHAVALVFDILGASLDFIQGHTVQGKGYAGQLGFVQFHPRRFAIRKGQVQGFDVGKIAADSGSIHSQSLCIRGGQLGTSFNRKSCHVRIDGQEEAIRFINKLCRAACCRNGQ